jgi:hypothetical protein
MSKPLHTLLAVFTGEAGCIWTSCGKKRLKYSVNGRGVRCASYFGVNSICIRCVWVLQASLNSRRRANLRRRFLSPALDEIFGAVSSAIR